MPLVVSETIDEKDYDLLFEVDYKAFSYEPVITALYPGGLDPSARAQSVAAFKTAVGYTDPQVKVAKIVDDQSGQICAYCALRISDKNPYYPAKDSELRFPHVDEDKRPFVEWVFNTKNDRRREMKELQIPGSYGCIEILSTDPTRQREGAATLLIKWATDKIDAKGCRAVLEASKVATQYRMYEKHGFRTIDVHTYTHENMFSGANPVTLVTMVREGKGNLPSRD